MIYPFVIRILVVNEFQVAKRLLFHLSLQDFNKAIVGKFILDEFIAVVAHEAIKTEGEAEKEVKDGTDVG